MKKKSQKKFSKNLPEKGTKYCKNSLNFLSYFPFFLIVSGRNIYSGYICA